MTSRWARCAAGMILVALLAACGSEGGTPAPVPVPSGSGSAPASPAPPPEPPVQPVGQPAVVAGGFTSPWSVVRLASGSALVSERDTGLVKEITDAREVRVVGRVPGVQPGGEGGLLGLAVADDEQGWLYAYFTSPGDNRIVRFALEGDAGALALGAGEEILTGLRKAGNHNGGRIAFGPDGMLYATVGDASDRGTSQDPGSLNGKILRMTPTGAVPADNPIAGSLVYSLGHRNPQGLAWDGFGQLWAAEFGQNQWDELNAIQPGANYGWPNVEGVASDPAFVNPVHQWTTSEASPSGLGWVRGTFFLAALRGQRVWAVYTEGAVTAVPWFEGTFGRIRDAVAGPDGSLWILTSNTDGRGEVQPGDDKLLQVELESLPAG